MAQGPKWYRSCPKWFSITEPAFWGATFLTIGTILFLLGQCGLVVNAWTIILVISAGFFLLGTLLYWVAAIKRMYVKYKRDLEEERQDEQIEREGEREDALENRENAKDGGVKVKTKKDKQDQRPRTPDIEAPAANNEEENEQSRQ
jgi:hypothetical protein